MRLHLKLQFTFALGFALAVTAGCGPTTTTLQDDDGRSLNLVLRSRSAAITGDPQVQTREVQWSPRETAFIVIDMWNEHWCEGATQRVEELAPRFNEVLTELRNSGVLIIHAPSGTMNAYENTPARLRAQFAPRVEAPVDVGSWCSLDPDKEAALPIDDSDGGCDCDPRCQERQAWTSQIDGIEISDEDAVSDSGQEIYNLFRQHEIRNVLIAGVHTNMCVLGRPFGIRKMVELGMNTVLVRDLTDTMYNSRMPPYVDHFQGTELVIEHIETYWCPSITSSDLIGGDPFTFSRTEVRQMTVSGG